MIKKIIGLIFVLTLTFGCITTATAAYSDDRKIENAKVWQEGDKVCISGYYSALDGTPVYNAEMRIYADYDKGLMLVGGNRDYLGNSKPSEVIVAEPGRGVYMITKEDGYFELILDEELIKRNDLQKIMIQNTYYKNVKAVVFDRDVDGLIVDYLDKK